MAGHKQKQVNNSTSRSSINQHQQHSNNNQSNNQHDHHQQQPPQRHLQTSKQPIECFNCHKPIRERFLLKALDQYWHEDCLKCSCCDCRLGEVGSTLFTKANLILCKRDYLRLFGNTGYCSACNKTIPGFEMVMKAKSNVYHLECFSCFQCHQKFCVGDRFYLFENKILCEYDYEERMLFASLSRNNITTNNSNNFIDSIQRHQPHQQQQQQSLSLSQSSLHHQQQHSQYHHSQQPTHNHQQQPSSSSMHPYLNNHSNHSHNQPLSHHNHHQQQQPQQQQQQPLNKMDGDALCDASSGYGSGDSPFDH